MISARGPGMGTSSESPVVWRVCRRGNQSMMRQWNPLISEHGDAAIRSLTEPTVSSVEGEALFKVHASRFSHLWRFGSRQAT